MAKMTEQEAKDKAIEKVYIYMCRGDIEYECKKRNIRIVKDRCKMEQKLIQAYIKEWTI